MSTNIITWKIREIRLVLPIAFDFQQWVQSQPDRDKDGYANIGKRWCLEEWDKAVIWTNLAAQTWKLDVLDHTLSGMIENDTLVATKLDWTGEESGYLYSDILLPLFKEFQGVLEAIVVWEGSSVCQLTIRNGVIEDEEM
jgi:hypothetical protein